MPAVAKFSSYRMTGTEILTHHNTNVNTDMIMTTTIVKSITTITNTMMSTSITKTIKHAAI